MNDITVNTLLKHKQSGEFGTVVAKYNKAIVDEHDYEANEAGYDSCTIATVVDVLFHNGTKRSGITIKSARKWFEVIAGAK